jgi:PAS domain S-box-containing protein
MTSFEGRLSPRYGRALFLGLIVAGLAGNYFNVDFFLNVNFLFGSIFSMLALQVFGMRAGLLATALIASYTWILWNHPYATIILIAEILFVGWAAQRHKLGMVLADMLYWLVLGIPMVYLFYKLVMDVSTGSVYILMLKQAINGIANVLIARLLFTLWILISRGTLISYRDLIYNLLAMFALWPVLIVLMLVSQRDLTDTEQRIHEDLHKTSKTMVQSLNTWMQNRVNTVLHLTAIASKLTAQQMQVRLEQAHGSDTNFLRIGMRNTESVITAYSPPIDELGKPIVGRKLPERPYIPELIRTLKPMFTEVVMGRIGKPMPVVILLAPVVIASQYSGYINTVLSLDQIKDHLDMIASGNTLQYTLVDKTGMVILSNRPDAKVMTPFTREVGRSVWLDDDTFQWTPPLADSTPMIQLWERSLYVTETQVSKLADWRLILEQPIAPFQKLHFARYADALALLFVILLAALALAEFVSRKMVVTLSELSELTDQLPTNLQSGHIPDWPISALNEPQRLIDNFKNMATSLTTQFSAVQQANETLERRVEARSAELQQSEKRLHTLIDWTREAITVHRNGVVIYVNPAAMRMVGASSAQELIGQSILNRVHPDFLEIVSQRTNSTIIDGIAAPMIEEKFLKLDGTVIDVEVQSTPIDFDGQPAVQVVAHDITERKRAETAARQLNQELVNSKQLLRDLAAQSELLLEDERKHIAREVHDELGQLLTAVRMEMSLLGKRFGATLPALQEEIEAIKALTDRAIAGVRNVAGNLRPIALDMGLIPAIDWLCGDFSTRNHIVCQLHSSHETIQLDEPRAVAVFRIVQESLTNISRHAHAIQVDISISCRANTLRVNIQDDGVGFDTSAVDPKKYGLLGMSERALALGGRIEISSTPGQGACIELTIPIAASTEKEIA